MDEAAKIAVSVEVQLDELKAGLAAAQAQIAGMADASAKTQERAAERAARTQEREAKRAADAVAREAARAAKEMDREISAAQRRVEAQQRAAFGAAEREMQTFARRANVLLAAQGIVTGIAGVRAIAATLNGEFEKSQTLLERLPGPLGETARQSREIFELWTGIAEKNAEVEAIQKRAAMDQAAWAKRSGLLQEVLTGESSGRSQTALDRGDWTAAQAEMEADLRRRMDRRRQELLKDGQDRVLIERSIALQVAAEQEKINDRIAAARRELDDKALERARQLHKNEIDDARRVADEKKRGEEEYRRIMKESIDEQIESRRQYGRQLEDQMKAAEAVRGSNFVSSVSTGIGAFRVGQYNGSEAVARAQIRAAELLAKINENTKSMADLARERDAVSSLR